MTQAEKVKVIAKVLKATFVNLTEVEVINIAYEILEALEEPI